MFISFEGVDGSGKSTQAALLVQALAEAGHEVVAVREPGGSPLAERIRSLLLDPGLSVNPRAELLLFTAARAQLVSDVVAPALARGAVVIADRFSDSTHAYQGAGRGVASDGFIGRVSAFATGGVLPHLTFLVDVPIDVARRRLAGTRADRMEQAGEGFQRTVRQAYLARSRSDPHRFVVLDGTLSASALHVETLTRVLTRLASTPLPR